MSSTRKRRGSRGGSTPEKAAADRGSDPWAPFRRPPLPPFSNAAWWARRAFFAVTLAVPRILLMLFTWFAMLGLCYAVALAQWLADRSSPRSAASGAAGDAHVPALTGWRASALRRAGKLLARLCLLSLGYWRVDVVPPEDGDAGDGDRRARAVAPPRWQDVRGVVVCNHVSYVDILWAMSTFMPGFLAKSAVAEAPVFGTISRVMGSLFVDRSRKGGTAAAMMARLREDRVREFAPLLVFPEGTTTNGETGLLNFRSGAFLGGTPVQPVVLRYPYERGGFSPAYESIGAFKHVLLLVTQWSNHVEAKWLPRYVPSDEEKADPKQYARNVCEVMAAAAGLPVVQSTWNDKREYHDSLKR